MPENTNKLSTPEKLKRFFRIGRKTFDKQKLPYPYEYKQDSNDNVKFAPVNLPPDVQKYYKWYVENCFDNPETLAARMQRYQDLDFMFYNSTTVSMACTLVADETIQPDSQDKVISVEAKTRKLSDKIYGLLEDWGYDKTTLWEKAFDLALYGDSFNVNSIDSKKGVTGSTPIDVRVVEERLELNISKEKNKMVDMRGALNSLANRYKSLHSLLSNYDNKDFDYSKMYQSYLFGYKMSEEMVLPPWAVSHFRLFSSKSEFFPYGRSLFINAISPFRQLLASKNLMVMARACKFPKEVFKVKTDENMSAMDVWNAVNEVRQMYAQLPATNGNKAVDGISDQIWLPNELLEFDLKESNVDLESIADIELLDREVVNAVRVPLGYIYPDNGGFGQSGQTLLQQFKPFARMVYQVQSAILEELTQIIKVHFLITGEFEGEDTEFELSMNFPVTEDFEDKMSLQSKSIDFSKDLIDTMKEVMGFDRDSELPYDMVQDIFSKYSFLDSGDLEVWKKQIDKHKAENPTDDTGDDKDGFSFESNKLSEATRKKLKARLNEGILRECFFDCRKRKHLHEGLYNRRHFLNSYAKKPTNNKVLELVRKEFKTNSKV